MPAEIAEAFKEAARALHAECPRASAVMARRTLEAITVDKGQTTGDLGGRLKNLAATGILLPTLADWAKEVRLVGNVGAHFDPIKSVSKNDAQQLVTFVRELLKYLYELPAELAKRKAHNGRHTTSFLRNSTCPGKRSISIFLPKSAKPSRTMLSAGCAKDLCHQETR